MPKSTHDLRNHLNNINMHAELGRMLLGRIDRLEDQQAGQLREVLSAFETILEASASAVAEIDGMQLIEKNP